MKADEAIRDLLSFSTDVHAVAVLGPEGDVIAAAPGAAAGALRAAAGRLWRAAEARAAALGSSPLCHVVVQDEAGGVGMLQAHGGRIVAVTGARPAVGLLLFDLRTCLGDALAQEDVP